MVLAVHHGSNVVSVLGEVTDADDAYAYATFTYKY